MTIAESLLAAQQSISRFDAELLLSDVLGKNRGFLRAFSEQILSQQQQQQYQNFVKRRQQHEPIAYIVGHREFWSLDLQVTPDVLIPRADSELLVEIALRQSQLQVNGVMADLGTGSGALALAFASEKPHWQVFATDQQARALTIAKTNAHRLAINNIGFFQGNWCQALTRNNFDMIMSNPPYIANNDHHLQKNGLGFEPMTALTAGEDGLDCIRIISQQAKYYLKPGGVLLLEHGYDQRQAVQQILRQNDYQAVKSERDLSGQWRVTHANR